MNTTLIVVLIVIAFIIGFLSGVGFALVYFDNLVDREGSK